MAENKHIDLQKFSIPKLYTSSKGGGSNVTIYSNNSGAANAIKIYEATNGIKIVSDVIQFDNSVNTDFTFNTSLNVLGKIGIGARASDAIFELSNPNFVDLFRMTRTGVGATNVRIGNLGSGNITFDWRLPTLGSRLTIRGAMSVGNGYADSSIGTPVNGLAVQGRVGIGLPNPAYTLDVSGNINLNGEITKNLNKYTYTSTPNNNTVATIYKNVPYFDGSNNIKSNTNFHYDPSGRLDVKQSSAGSTVIEGSFMGDHNNDAYGHLFCWGYSDNNKRMSIGFNTAHNYGYLQSYYNGGSKYPIKLNPQGGDVYITASSLRLQTESYPLYFDSNFYISTTSESTGDFMFCNSEGVLLEYLDTWSFFRDVQFNGNDLWSIGTLTCTSTGTLPIIKTKQVHIQNPSSAIKYTLTVDSSNYLIVKNSSGLNIISIDENGNLKVRGDITFQSNVIP